MTTIVKLIIKVMNGNNISIILDNNQIPNTFLSNLNPDIVFEINSIAKKFNIHEAYVVPKLTYFGTDNGEPEVYYTIIAPKDFLDEKIINKLSNNFEQLSQQDRIAIRQSFSILPY